MDIRPADLFDKLKSLGWIERKNDKWILTDQGKKKGGQTRTSPNYGEYIVWPENIQISNSQGHSGEKPKLINSTALGTHFNISSKRANLILNELGWIQKTVAGWSTTQLGKTLGGKQFEHDTSGNSYVMWPSTIFQNSDLLEVFDETPKQKVLAVAKNVEPNKEKSDSDTVEDFRKKYPTEYRTKDGHLVRSKAELTIDDSLYLWGIVHA